MLTQPILFSQLFVFSRVYAQHTINHSLCYKQTQLFLSKKTKQLLLSSDNHAGSDQTEVQFKW